MASVNKVIIVGNLGDDPTTRYLPSGDAVTNISVATTDKWKNKDGEKQEATEWHRISFFGKLAEIAGEYLKKGSQVYIEGRIRTNKWQDKDGNDRYTTQIIADRMQMLGARPSGNQQTGGAPAGEQRKQPAKKSGGSFDDMDDDIPFSSTAMLDDPVFRKHYGRGF